MNICGALIISRIGLLRDVSLATETDLSIHYWLVSFKVWQHPQQIQMFRHLNLSRHPRAIASNLSYRKRRPGMYLRNFATLRTTSANATLRWESLWRGFCVLPSDSCPFLRSGVYTFYRWPT